MKIFKFSAIRPVSGFEKSIASLPYDVMDTEEARHMADGNRDSFLHVVRSEIDLPDGTDPHSSQVYEAAGRALRKLTDDGRMFREDTPSLYIYRQTMNGRAQTAVVACCRIDDYANGTILRHEKTRKDKEDDRTNHILATNANTGQVFLTYRDQGGIDALVREECRAAPLYDFTADDGVGHTVWKAADPDAIAAAFESVPKAYIADGHHRSAASYRAGMEKRRLAGADFNPDAEYNRFMACLFPASQLKILPYNRCVRDLNGMDAGDFLEAVRGTGAFTISETDEAASDKPCSCVVIIKGRKWKLEWNVPDGADPVSVLDVSYLQENLLAPVLGIGDPRTDPRIFFVGGIRGTGELVRVTSEGLAAAAFSMYPVTISQMMDIADSGGIMPPKSTWFEPKLRSGLLVHTL